jgi:hypothetical protein
MVTTYNDWNNYILIPKIERKEKKMETMNMEIGVDGITYILLDAYHCKRLEYLGYGIRLRDIPLELIQDVAEVLMNYEYSYDQLWDVVKYDFCDYTEAEAIAEFESTDDFIHNPRFPDLYIRIDGITHGGE